MPVGFNEAAQLLRLGAKNIFERAIHRVFQRSSGLRGQQMSMRTEDVL